MNKEELVTVVWSKLNGITKEEVRVFVNTFIESVNECLTNCDELKIQGFGKFEVRNSKPRLVRHPRTGEETLVESKRQIKFKAYPKLKELLNEKYN